MPLRRTVVFLLMLLLTACGAAGTSTAGSLAPTPAGGTPADAGASAQGPSSPGGSSPATPASPSPSPGTPSAPQGSVDCAVATCIALTYDDGPGPLTPALLDAFTSRGATATLFMIGQSAQAHPDIVAAAHARGFEIANHSWSHPPLATLDDAAVAIELGRTSDVLEQITGERPDLLRPPYASRNARTDAIAAKEGLAVVVWDNSPEDWVHRDADTIARLTLERSTPGAIILSHDINRWTVDAAPAIIDRLQAQGYHLVTVSQLLGATQAGALYPA